MSYSVLTLANFLIKYLGVCLSISMAKCFALQVCLVPVYLKEDQSYSHVVNLNY